MSSDASTSQDPVRLNPFAFPSDTDFRFVLLVVAVLGASLFLYNAIYFSVSANQTYYLDTVAHCLDIRRQTVSSPPTTSEGLATASEQMTAAQVAFEQCRAAAERANAVWALGGTALLLVVAGGIFWLLPVWKIRRSQLTLLSAEDAPDVLAYLEQLCQEARLACHPTFLWNPLNAISSALAFGRPGHYYVALSGGLVTQYYTDQPAFRAVVLHELAHLRNADVSKTYFAIAVWQAFVIAGLIPFAFSLWNDPLDYILNLSWRVLGLTAIIFLMRNAVLRTREVYADIRASVWDGPAGALRRILAALPVSKARPWQRGFHPKAAERRRALDDTTPLFRMGFWVAFGTGAVAMVAVPNIVTILTSLLTGVPQSGLEFLGAVMIFAPLAAGVVGLGVWRSTFADLAQGGSWHKLTGLGIALGLGVIVGQALSLSSYIELSVDQQTEQAALSVFFELLWSMLLLVGLLLFIWWIFASASTWLEVAAAQRSPRPIYTIALVVAGFWLSLWFAFLITAHRLGPISLQLLMFDPLSVLWSVVLHPLTLLMLISLWAFPLAAWFWGRRTHSVAEASWAFLEAPPLAPLSAQQVPLRPRPAIITGLAGGVMYYILLLVIRLGLRLAVPEAQRTTDEFLLSFFMGTIALAALMQIGVAVIVAAWVRRLGWVHGLFAAFVAGCAMTLGNLGLNLLFGGTMNLTFVWYVFSQIVNDGALLALPFALAVSALSGWIRRSEARSMQSVTA